MLVFSWGEKCQKLLDMMVSMSQLVTGWGLHQNLSSVRWGMGFRPRPGHVPSSPWRRSLDLPQPG